MYQFPQKILHW